ncbi:MAG: 5-oxoprolinase subunit PxpB [Pyrinomonadaceae bacterium]
MSVSAKILLPEAKIHSLGESAVTISFGDSISLETNQLIRLLSDAVSDDPFPGYIESVPCYSSLTIFFDPMLVKTSLSETDSPHGYVSALVLRKNLELDQRLKSVTVKEIPAEFNHLTGVDLEFVSEYAGVSTDEVIAIFTESVYSVFMIGFLPGFAYMGTVDSRIAAPRLETPRINVPAGSIGIAGKQTGIYPFDSPGGWRIIGRTAVKMFDPSSIGPSTLRQGDLVRFVPEEEFGTR